VFELGLGLPQSALQLLDLRTAVVGKGPDGDLLDVERVERGLDVHALTACWPLATPQVASLLAARWMNGSPRRQKTSSVVAAAATTAGLPTGQTVPRATFQGTQSTGSP
jgi:hypothetical protein